MIGSSGPETSTVQLSTPMPREGRDQVLDGREPLFAVAERGREQGVDAPTRPRAGKAHLRPESTREQDSGSGRSRTQNQVDRGSLVQADPGALNARRERMLDSADHQGFFQTPRQPVRLGERYPPILTYARVPSMSNACRCGNPSRARQA